MESYSHKTLQKYPLAYDRLIRRFQTASEREADGRKKGYSGILEADLQRSEAKVEALRNPDDAAQMRYRRDEKGEIIGEEKGEVPLTREEGRQRWSQELELRFLRGADTDFEYGSVDKNEEYDDRQTAEREVQEAWFDEEEPKWVAQGVDKVACETGIQDF
ncbi:uncharacterized protein KY384_000506 [Bacidia gigantensis]|uniref:uncharacterized protein n=1 Tax=Bacidia gigantensis TaxID=2732470 RepID=UPI001D058C53|nr:uncharacterized protein KY384_000506 [Bacidia gigantensis]KAG8525746.1 hypothetical protein KY384_000506 [Bacidia gigantensis]